LKRRFKIPPGWLWKSIVLITLVSLIGYWFCLPDPLFDAEYSTVLEGSGGELLGAKIADDGQWRFPQSPEIPEKFTRAIIEFEDRNFNSHPGVDPIAVGRAIVQNYKAGEVVSGASTLSMQVIRLAKKNPDRTVWEKLKEMIQATRLELSYSKDEILAMYAAHAPFGGNTVGLEAASWRYFGRSPEALSWAESAMLAVLPNSPALIHPGRNRDALRAKRDRLLDRLYSRGVIDSLTLSLSKLEGLPDKPRLLPQVAPHYLAQQYLNANKGQRVSTDIDPGLQQQVNSVVEYHHRQLRANGINNAAVVVLDVRNQQVISYVGNTQAGKEHDAQVDVIRAPRSTGSILKPLLYMLKLNNGEMLPNTMVPDVPSRFSEYSPENYSRTYSGAVHASEALARSLNVPAVYMLQEFGVPNFHFYLNEFGFSTITQEPDHYGLTLILGGAEATLWDVTSVYGSLAAMLNNYDSRETESKNYSLIDFDESSEQKAGFEINPGALWSTFEAMVDVNRPEDEAYWRRFDGSRRVAWKTGTSYGNRDGWAVGVTPEYVVGVWVGNADGEGRPELTGIRTAGPLLFNVYNLLPATSWFNEPIYEMEEIEVCSISGHRKGQYCEIVDTVKVPKTGLKTTFCPYHQLVNVNSDQTRRLNSSCASVSEIEQVSWFVLPPDQEWYYRRSHPEYRSLPPKDLNCGEEDMAAMKMIYPFKASSIYVPLELDGETGKTVFEVAHRTPSTKIYWHLDDQFLGETRRFHQWALSPEPGKHTLVLVDEHGERLEQRFEVIRRSASRAGERNGTE
jgi:penicillin-binding protein 1C